MERIDSLPPEIELAQLVQRCAARDVGAFRLLYEKTSAIVHARLLRMLRRRSLAAAALQEVYVRVWERAAQYEAGRGRPLAWLLAITRYCAIDFAHRDALTHVADDAPAAADALVADNGPTASSAAPNHFDEGLAALSGDARRCLTLAYVEARTHGEIAQLTSRSPGVIRKTIRAALSSLKDALPSAHQAA